MECCGFSHKEKECAFCLVIIATLHNGAIMLVGNLEYIYDDGSNTAKSCWEILCFSEDAGELWH